MGLIGALAVIGLGREEVWWIREEPPLGQGGLGEE